MATLSLLLEIGRFRDTGLQTRQKMSVTNFEVDTKDTIMVAVAYTLCESNGIVCPHLLLEYRAKISATFKKKMLQNIFFMIESIYFIGAII